ncbi:MAG: agmatine deiminase family protein [Zavarzinella sp.]
MIPDWDVNSVFLANLLQVCHAELFTELIYILKTHEVKVRLLHNVKDIWSRDYCPIQISLGEWLQFRYEPDYLKNYPELRTDRQVADQFRKLGKCHHSTINIDGGNVVASRNKAILTDKIYRENPSWDRPVLRDELRNLLQVDQLIIIPKEPYDPVGHADAIVRFISEDTVLLNNYAEIDPLYGNRVANILHRHGLKTELLPYFIEQQSVNGIPSALGLYANFLRTSKVIIVPAFGTESDQIVLNRLISLINDVPIVLLDCKQLAREGGILNCICASYLL